MLDENKDAHSVNISPSFISVRDKIKGDVIRMAREVGMDAMVGTLVDGKYEPKKNALKRSVPAEWLECLADKVAVAAATYARDACVRICDEMQEYWAAEKDTALLNGNVQLSNAMSGESRAAESLARLMRSLDVA